MARSATATSMSICCVVLRERKGDLLGLGGVIGGEEIKMGTAGHRYHNHNHKLKLPTLSSLRPGMSGRQ